MTIAVDLGRKATKQTNKQTMSSLIIKKIHIQCQAFFSKDSYTQTSLNSKDSYNVKPYFQKIHIQ